MKNLRTTLRSAGTATLTGAALLLAGCGEDHADHQAAAGPGQEVQDHGDGTVQIDDALARRLGVTLVEARLEDLHRTVRGTGEVVWDETRLSTVSLRFGGWAERLYVDFTGRWVTAGDPLLEVYSPELVAAQEDLLGAVRLARELADSRVPGSPGRGEVILDAARERLRFWKVSEADIRALEETGEVRAHLTLAAPSTGYVVEKNVQAGERFDAGAPLYRLADLSRVWLEVDVYERDLRWMRLDGAVEVEVAAHPGERIQGRIGYIYPDVDRARRTARVRVELPNPGGLLKPGMYGTARTEVTLAEGAVTVPRDAVMYTGERALVFVAHGNGRYETRSVEVGAEAGDRVQIRSGLDAGERVVARSGFLLDAESRLMEAMMGQPGMPGMDMDMPGMEMDMPGMEMDETEMEMDMPGMEMEPGDPESDDPHDDSAPGRSAPEPSGHDHPAHDPGGPDA